MFHHSEINNINKFFKENGYVVITNVINEKEIENTINEICTHPALLGDYNFDLNDLSTRDLPYINDHGFIDINLYIVYIHF